MYNLWFLPRVLNLLAQSWQFSPPLPRCVWIINNTFRIGTSYGIMYFLAHSEFLQILIVMKTYRHILIHRLYCDTWRDIISQFSCKLQFSEACYGDKIIIFEKSYNNIYWAYVKYLFHRSMKEAAGWQSWLKRGYTRLKYIASKRKKKAEVSHL